MMKKVRGMKSPITLRRLLPLAAVLLVFALVFVAPAAAVDPIKVSTQTELDAAIQNVAQNGNEPTKIELVAGTYILHNSGVYNYKKIIFNGTEEGVIFDATSLGNELYGDELTFKNVAIKFPDTSHKGITHTNKVVFEDCTFNGTQTLYAKNGVEFDNCIFKDNDGKDIYYVWTYGVNVTFTSCTFYTNGKAILAYHENELESTIKLKDCVFYSDSTIATDKAAVETGDGTAKASVYRITITDCIAEGFVPNNSDSPLWGNKNSMPLNERLFVTITLTNYAVTWKVADNERTDEVPYGQKPDYNGVPTKDPTPQYSYIFEKWENENGETFTNENLPIVREDVTYTAVFTETPRTYTVLWTNETGFEFEKDENVLYGEMPSFDGTEPQQAEDEKYTYAFDGWNPELSPVTEERTYTAVFEKTKKDYLLTWDFNGGDTTDTAYTQEGRILWGEPLDYPDEASMVRSGYTFSGWNKTLETMPTADTTIKARWTEVTPTPDPSPEPSPSEYKGSSVWLTETPTPTETVTPTPSETVPTVLPTEKPNDEGFPLWILLIVVLVVAVGVGVGIYRKKRNP